MIGKLAGRAGRSAAKLLRKDATVPKIGEAKTRKSIRKEMVDLGTPAAVAGKEAPRAHTPPPQREAGLTAGATSTKQRAGWKSKIKILDRLDEDLTNNESRITALRKKSEATEDRGIKMRLATQINKLKNKIKTIKERMSLEREGMKDMRKRYGPAVQVAKTGGTVKRSKGGLIGMGAALRGGGAVRRI